MKDNFLKVEKINEYLYIWRINLIIMPHFILKKMLTNLSDVVEYQIVNDKEGLLMNDLIGKNVEIRFTEKINCVKCGTETKKSFGQGYCYKCFSTAPEADVCIVQPEKCMAHEGVSRDMEWAKNNCLRSHYVYLAKTSAIKVGVTRESQIPTRWIDQGADSAIKLAKTPYRQLAGLIEVAMKQYFTDKTSWQRMLKNETTNDNLIEAKNQAISKLSDEFKKFIVPSNDIISIKYPHIKVPTSVKSVKLDSQSVIQGTLTGIKGQYLIFDNEFVFNVRSHTGYNVEISFSKARKNVQQTLF